MKTRVCLIPGGYGEKDYCALEMYPESEIEYDMLLKMVSEFRKHGLEVKKIFSVKESIWGWIIHVPVPDTVDEDLKLKHRSYPLGGVYGHE